MSAKPTDEVLCLSCATPEETHMHCEECAYYEYDEDDDMYYCTVNMDEDDYARLIERNYRECPYYCSGDEYRVVRKQM